MNEQMYVSKLSTLYSMYVCASTMIYRCARYSCCAFCTAAALYTALTVYSVSTGNTYPSFVYTHHALYSGLLVTSAEPLRPPAKSASSGRAR